MERITKLAKQLDIQFPIIQAPMAGSTTPGLVAAVSNAGGLGSLGAAYMQANTMRDAIHKIRELTDKPFSLNLFIPNEHHASLKQIEQSCKNIEQACVELNYKIQPAPSPYSPNFDEQMQVVIDEKISAFSFIFGIPDKAWIGKLKKNNALLLGTATNVDEAILLEKSGIDIIIAQGSEAGGHRGTFIGYPEEGLIGLFSLIPQIVKYVKIPVIAAGGIMNAQGIAAAHFLGASGVQMGTVFLTCNECEIHSKYKEILLKTKKDSTVLTPAFSGRLARGIRNKFIERMAEHKEYILPFPIQNAITRTMRAEAEKQNHTDFMSMWAGQSAYLCKAISVKNLIRELTDEFSKIFKINLENGDKI